MRSFFRALEERRVRYLLISGQATVLHGASAFSEDVDLWVDPATINWRRMLDALEACEARVHKLTPPLQPQYAVRGHGFHFRLPSAETPALESFVDVMGAPPRVASFADCRERATGFDTDWGHLPVMSPGDLVLIKRTQRLADYAVISSLVRIACHAIRSREQWEWGVTHSFEAEDLTALWHRGKPLWRKAARVKRECVEMLNPRRRSPQLLRDISNSLALEIEQARQEDREYWRPIIAELKKLQKLGKLLQQGILVADAR